MKTERLATLYVRTTFGEYRIGGRETAPREPQRKWRTSPSRYRPQKRWAEIAQMSALVIIVLLIPSIVRAAVMYQAGGANGTYLTLNGATVKGKINVRLSPSPAVGPTWTFRIDNEVVGTTQVSPPIAMPEDNDLYDTVALTEGTHTLTAAASGQPTQSVSFTVDNVLDPSPDCKPTAGVGMRVRMFRSVPTGPYDKILIAWWCPVTGGYVTHPFVAVMQDVRKVVADNLAVLLLYTPSQLGVEFKDNNFTPDEQAQINSFQMTAPP